MAHRLTYRDVELALVDINRAMLAKGLRVAVEREGKGLTLTLQSVKATLARGLTKKAAIKFIEGMRSMVNVPGVQPDGQK